jgi:hypothetical protein
LWAGWAACSLVAPGGVEGEFAEQFAGGVVDDPDLEVADEEEDGGSGVGSPDADLVEASLVAQGDLAGVVDDVFADAVVGWGARAGRGGFGAGGVGGGWDLAADAAVWAVVVVVVAERVEFGLQVGDGAGAGSGGEPLLEGLVEALHFSAVKPPGVSGDLRG